jgi:uncharacterized coiled-coil DUF342 family protein
MSNDELYEEIEGLRVEIDKLKTFNNELLEKIDEIWKALTSLSLDMAANKINIDLVCRELIRKEKVL